MCLRGVGKGWLDGSDDSPSPFFFFGGGGGGEFIPFLYKVLLKRSVKRNSPKALRVNRSPESASCGGSVTVNTKTCLCLESLKTCLGRAYMSKGKLIHFYLAYYYIVILSTFFVFSPSFFGYISIHF